MFEVREKDSGSGARNGILTTARTRVATPVFMPVGTLGTVKMLTPAQVAETGARLILANTYHLMIRPGPAVVRALGGLHTFAGWEHGILTDSGGFQVFSLAKMRRVTDAGVTFRSHVDGSELFLDPVNVIAAQRDFGSDIVMVLDECPPADAAEAEVAAAVRRTIAWAERSREQRLGEGQRMFAIVQGGRFRDLRCECAEQLTALDFPGYAIGGLSVGEDRAIRREILAATAAALPADRPRYVMGIGEPVDILDAVACGCDMFDCVLPTRNGRNGSAFTDRGQVHVRNGCFTEAAEPVDPECTCYCCAHFSKGYIRHLFNVKEGLGPALLSIHNIYFFMRLTERIRTAVAAGTFGQFRRQFIESFYQGTLT